MPTEHETKSPAAIHDLPALLQRLAHDGDADAWRQLVSHLGDDLLRFTRRFTGDAALADDAAQETLLAIRDHAGAFRAPTVGNANAAARGWIMRIAINASLRQVRDRDRTAARERKAAAMRHAHEESHPEQVSRLDTAEIVRSELGKLSEANRTAVALHHLDGLSIADVGITLGISNESAKKRVRRGIAILRGRLLRLGITASVVATLNALDELPVGSTGMKALSAERLNELFANQGHVSSSLIPPAKGILLAIKIALPIAALLTVGTIAIGLTHESAKAGDSPTTPAPHPLEPAGFTQLSPTVSGDALPPTYPGPKSGAADDIGWVQSGGLTQEIDNDVPFPSKKVLQAFFPPGFVGGAGPAKMWPTGENWPGATPPHNARQLYMSFWYKISPGFPINLVANSIIRPAANGDHAAVATVLHAVVDYSLDANGIAHYTPGQVTPYNAVVIPSVAFQEVEIDGKYFAKNTDESSFGVQPEQWTQVKRGQWHHWETLYILESDGGAHDGSAFLWLDGKPLIHLDKRIRFCPTTTTVTPWKWADWTTVYGGGGSVPNDGVGGYHRMKDLYVSGK